MVRKYELLSDSTIKPEIKAGTIVYDCCGHDYGIARDDTNTTGIDHKSVTLEADGGYPFFTHPTHKLRLIQE